MKRVIVLFFVLGTAVAFAQTIKTAKLKKNRGAVILFEVDTFDFGEIWEGEKAEGVFQFKNAGTQPLIITDVIPTCGCTNPEWTKEAISPGETGKIKVSYDSQFRPGFFMKRIAVKSNAKNDGVKIIVIKGNVIKPAIAPSNYAH
jgi:hypothetical protein